MTTHPYIINKTMSPVQLDETNAEGGSMEPGHRTKQAADGKQCVQYSSLILIQGFLSLVPTLFLKKQKCSLLNSESISNATNFSFLYFTEKINQFDCYQNVLGPMLDPKKKVQKNTIQSLSSKPLNLTFPKSSASSFTESGKNKHICNIKNAHYGIFNILEYIFKNK